MGWRDFFPRYFLHQSPLRANVNLLSGHSVSRSKCRTRGRTKTDPSEEGERRSGSFFLLFRCFTCFTLLFLIPFFATVTADPFTHTSYVTRGRRGGADGLRGRPRCDRPANQLVTSLHLPRRETESSRAAERGGEAGKK